MKKPTRPARPPAPAAGTTRRAFVGGSLAAVLAAAIGIGGGVRGRRGAGKRPPIWIGHM